MEDKGHSILHIQDHGWWWPGDTRSQCIRGHCSDLVHPQYSSLCTRRILTHWGWHNSCLFPNSIFQCIFLNENMYISIKISLKFVPKGRITNIPELVQIMAWRHPGDKPLSEPMMVSLLMHICVTRPQWVNEKSRYWQASTRAPFWRFLYLLDLFYSFISTRYGSSLQLGRQEAASQSSNVLVSNSWYLMQWSCMELFKVLALCQISSICFCKRCWLQCVSNGSYVSFAMIHWLHSGCTMLVSCEWMFARLHVKPSLLIVITKAMVNGQCFLLLSLLFLFFYYPEA